jgi:hypothetical protein
MLHAEADPLPTRAAEGQMLAGSQAGTIQAPYRFIITEIAMHNPSVLIHPEPA